MIRLRKSSFRVILLALLVGQWGASAQSTNAAPDFKEVYDLVRAHARMSGEELDRAAVNGFLAELRPNVSLVTNGAPAPVNEEGPAVSRASLFDSDIAYVRIRRVEDGLPQALRQSCHELEGTNQLRGLVLDLRYAGGKGYAAAAATADLFVKKEQPLLNWGDGVVKSKEKSQALVSPVAVLVNEKTRGPAEALAAVLRETGVGLILGARTAGQALITQDFPLRDGEILRIGTAPVQVGDGATLSAKGVQPDIAVSVSSREQREYYADAFQAFPKTNGTSVADLALSSSATNHAARRPRFNEAELVRERREGVALEDAFSTNSMRGAGARAEEEDEESPVVHDPVLARALDLLKGLAVVRHTHS
jgi:hypothetical protein